MLVVLTCGLPAEHATAQGPQALKLSGDFGGTHDPSIAKDGDTWYVFATGKAPSGGQFAVRCSKDLKEWKLCGHVFDQIPEWIRQQSPETEELWAPDVSYYKGEYRLYYAYSVFGKNTSGIALATNKTLDATRPDYKWEDKGLVLKSLAGDNYNAIDPNFLVDAKGKTWLSFGSFWTGIKMRRLDEGSGKASEADHNVYSLASRARPEGAPANEIAKTSAEGLPGKPTLPPDWQAVEAPFIVAHGSYYYLFVSWDLCCRGKRSTYRTMVGRSKKPTGPYVDQKGKKMSDGGGTDLLTANARWLGPGGESVLMGKKGEKDLMVFHAYDAETGKPALQISTIDWTGGWPHVTLGSE
jgi:arabinan endo-1,5-alpha-L-arabinosidase